MKEENLLIRFDNDEEGIALPSSLSSLFLCSHYEDIVFIGKGESEDPEEELTYVSFLFKGNEYSKEDNIELERDENPRRNRFVLLPIGISR